MDAYISILLTRSMKQCSCPLKNIKDIYFFISFFLYISTPNIFFKGFWMTTTYMSKKNKTMCKNNKVNKTNVCHFNFR